MADLDEADLERLVQLLGEHPHQRGQLRRALLGEETSDLRDAIQRLAEAQGRTGIPALGVVAGESVTGEAARAARDFGGWQVTDGQLDPPAA